MQEQIQKLDYELFKPSEEVLVFVEGESLHVDPCGRTKRIRDASADIEYLNGIISNDRGQKTAK